MDKMDIRVALSVADKITTYGERRGEGFFLAGLLATPSFDGYTVTISDEKVSMDIQFHNKFILDYESKKSLNEFMLKLERVERDY